MDSTLGEAFFDNFVVAEPEVGNVCGAEAEDVFQRAADLADVEIDTNTLEKFKERLCALCENGFGTNVVAAETMVGHDVNCLRPSAVTDDVKEAASLFFDRGEPCCHT